MSNASYKSTSDLGFASFMSLFVSPEQPLFQLSGYHGKEGGSPSVEHVQFHIGCHDLCGDICVCSHTGSTAATEHPVILQLQ